LPDALITSTGTYRLRNIVYKAGKPVRAIGVVHDITEQKKWKQNCSVKKYKKEERNYTDGSEGL
jgi:hypothetical protein